VREWTALLKDVAGSIPVPIQDGQCELFPAEGTEKQRTGRAIRIPGSYNPNTDSSELIIAETIRPLLDQLTEEASTHTRESATPGDLVRDREVNNSSYGTKRLYLLDQPPRKEIAQNRKQNGFLSPTTSKLIEDTIAKHPILAKGTRHKVLATLTGDLIHKFGFTLSCDVVQAHWANNIKNLTTEYPEHFREFGAIWKSLLEEIVGNFSAKELAIYDKLNTTPQQEAFVLLRSFAYLADSEPFPIAQNSLADRLRQTQQGASYIIKVLIGLEAITPAEKARINRRAARYRWLAAYAANNGGTSLISSPSGSDAQNAITLQSKPGDVQLATHKELEERTKSGLARATARAAEGAAKAAEPLQVSNTAHLRDLAQSAARVFGWAEGGVTVNANQALVVTQEQLEQIRQLRAVGVIKSSN
jgi:hypothetical protein